MGQEGDPSTLAALLFRAAGGLLPWSSALDALREALQASHHALWLRSTSNLHVVSSVASSIPEDATGEYVAHYGAMDPIVPLGAALPPGTVFVSDELFPFDELRRTTFYNEWMGRLHLRRYIAATTRLQDGENFAAIAFQRAIGSDPFSRRDLELMRQLMPQLGAAMEVWACLRAAPAARAEACLLDRVEAAIALVDAEGLVYAETGRFREFLDVGDGLYRDAKGRFRAVEIESSIELAASLRRTALTRLATSSKIARRHSRRSYQVLVSPFDAPGRFADADRATLLVRVLDPERRDDDLKDTLMARHLLTPAEADVTLRLSRGASIHAIAGATGRTVETTRNLLKRALAKTETHRQAELVALVHAVRNDSDGG